MAARWQQLLLAGGFRLLARKAQDRVGFILERDGIDLHSVEHRAPVPRDRRHGYRLANLLVGGAVELGGGGVKINAVVTRDLCRDSKAAQFLGPAVKLG